MDWRKLWLFRKEKAAQSHCITAAGYQEEKLEGGRGWDGKGQLKDSIVQQGVAKTVFLDEIGWDFSPEDFQKLFSRTF